MHLLIVLGICIACPTMALSQDVTTQTWSKLFRAGKRDELLKELTANLEAGTHVPEAAEAWIAVYSLQKSEETQWKSLPEGKLKSALTPFIVPYLDGKGAKIDAILKNDSPQKLIQAKAMQATVQVASALLDDEKYDEAAPYLDAIRKIDPSSFQFSRLILIRASNTRMRAIAKHLAPGGSLADHPAAAGLAKVINHHNVSQPLRGFHALSWSKNHPNDSRTLSYAGDILLQEGQLERARTLLTQAYELSPWLFLDRGYAPSLAAANIRLGDEPKSRELAKIWSIYDTPEDTNRSEIREFARYCAIAGEGGRVREIVTNMEGKFPNDYYLHYLLSLQELRHSYRAPQALTEAQRSIESRKNFASAWLSEIKALIALKRVDEAKAVLDRALNEGVKLSEDAYTELINAIASTKDKLSIIDRGLQAYPRSDYLQVLRADAFIALDRNGEASEILKSVISRDVNYSYAISRYGKCSGNESLKKLVEEFPAAKEVWKAYVRTLPKAEKQTAWREAARLNPDEYWPVDLFDRFLNDEKRYDDSISNATQALTRFQSTAQEFVGEASGDIGWAMNISARNGGTTKEFKEQALRHLQLCLEMGGDATIYSAAITDLQGLLDNTVAQKKALIDNVLARPDSYDPIIDIQSANLKGLEVARVSHRYLNRDPFDSVRLVNVANTHLLWSGSPIVAYSMYQRAEEIDPSSDFRGDKSRALGQLGDAQSEFANVYFNRRSAVSNSERYIGWFNTSRLAAQRPGARVDIYLPKDGNSTGGPIDITHPLARILRADGTVEYRQSEPVSGKYAYVQVGQHWVSLNYDPTGTNLLRIRVSNGREINLTYNSENRISAMTNKSGGITTAINLKYDSAGKILQITVQNLGSIDFTYDKSGKSSSKSSGGPEVLRKATATLTALTDAIKVFASGDVSHAPDLGIEDPQLIKLIDAEQLANAKFEASGTEASQIIALKAAMAVTRHYIDHLADSSEYQIEATARLETLFQETAKSKVKGVEGIRASAIVAWQDLMLRTRPEGLAADDWKRWIDLLVWIDKTLQSPGDHSELYKANKAINDKGRTLEGMKGVQWLPDSYLDNDGFWRRTLHASMAPANLLDGLKIQALATRPNGTRVVGTNKGIAVLDSYWRFYRFDSATGRFSTDSLTVDEGRSNVLSLVSVGDKILVGTAAGLYSIDKFDAPVSEISLPEGFTARITHLAYDGKTVWAGTPRGVLRVIYGTTKLEPTLPGSAVRFLHARDGVLVAGFPESTVALRGSKQLNLGDGTPIDAIWMPSQKSFFVLGSELDRIQVDESGALGSRSFVRGQAGIRRTNAIFGLAVIPVEDDVEALAVLTDLGMSIYRDEHFEHKKLPYVDMPEPAVLADFENGIGLVASNSSLFSVEKGRALNDLGAVVDIATDEKAGLVYVAREDKIEVINANSDNPKPLRFASISAQHLAVDKAGKLYANDLTDILTYDRGSTTPHLLFSARSNEPKPYDAYSRNVTSILCAQNGDVWVSTGPTVYRYHQGKVDSYGQWKDPKVAPFATVWISRVLETPEGAILVVASNEGHNLVNGVSYRGGVFAFDKDHFFKVDGYDGNDMPLAITPLGNDSAIWATVGSFMMQKADLTAKLSKSDTSYQALQQRQPMLWMGTKGTKFGPDTYLFGCAGGIIAYRNGTWYYPDRLNWMLPEPRYAQYGGRTIHAIATDSKGRVYAGTDRGLLIYNPEGETSLESLIGNERTLDLFADAEEIKQHNEAEVFVRGLKPGSPEFELLTQLRAERESEAQLRMTVGGSYRLPVGGAETVKSEQSADQAIQASTQLESNLKLQQETLLKLERQHPGMGKMFAFSPVDLRALGNRLAAGEVIVQYLPTPGRLLINVVRAGKEPSLVEVSVKQEELFSRTRAVQAGMQRLGRTRAEEANAITPSSLDALNNDLAWLYKQLLFPVEDLLKGSEKVIIVPAGALDYVPFAALIRDQKKPEYAIQKYAFSVMPSLYLYDLASQWQGSSLTESLVIGDPDGTLAGARSEASDVCAILKSSQPPALGNDATSALFNQRAPQSLRIHMATHGMLNTQRPENSYVLLANGYRLSVIDVSTMDLRKTRVAVLSACQTGLGGDGIEYATLARAFALAGIPSTVATLWQVDDKATPNLVKRFYQNLIDGKDIAVSLAEAQRTLISEGGDGAKPWFWCGFVLFGRP